MPHTGRWNSIIIRLLVAGLTVVRKLDNRVRGVYGPRTIKSDGNDGAREATALPCRIRQSFFFGSPVIRFRHRQGGAFVTR